MHNFRHHLKKTMAFFKPKNLAALTLKYEDEVALLVIDVQKKFCDPAGDRGNAETEAVSARIQSLVPEFRKAGIPVYAVYFSPNGEKADFYKFTPDQGDKLIAKSTNSAFASSNIKDILKKDHKKLLLTCGFNKHACVQATVLDARKAGFKVCLLEDLSGNDGIARFFAANLTSRDMQKAGVVMTTSEAVLKHLRGPRP